MCIYRNKYRKYKSDLQLYKIIENNNNGYGDNNNNSKVESIYSEYLNEYLHRNWKQWHKSSFQYKLFSTNQDEWTKGINSDTCWL